MEKHNPHSSSGNQGETFSERGFSGTEAGKNTQFLEFIATHGYEVGHRSSLTLPRRLKKPSSGEQNGRAKKGLTVRNLAWETCLLGGKNLKKKIAR